jgi:hypothetical protein
MPNSQVDTSVKSFTAGEDLAIYRLVKLTSGTLNYADAGDDSIGVTQASCDSGEQCAVKLWNSQGTFKIETAGAIVTETAVYVANDGKVDDAVSGSIIGVSIEVASASGEYIEIRKGEPTDIHVKSATVSDPAAAASPTTSHPQQPLEQLRLQHTVRTHPGQSPSRLTPLLISIPLLPHWPRWLQR